MNTLAVSVHFRLGVFSLVPVLQVGSLNSIGSIVNDGRDVGLDVVSLREKIRRVTVRSYLCQMV